MKQVLGRRGRLGATGVLDAAIAHRAHAPFMVDKLWSFFVTAPLPRETRRALARTYVRSGHRIAPVVRAILLDDALYERLDRPAMIKSPIVLIAGCCGSPASRSTPTTGRGSPAAWGQSLFRPPSVAGWDQGTAVAVELGHAHGACWPATWIMRDAPGKVADAAIDRSWSGAAARRCRPFGDGPPVDLAAHRRRAPEARPSLPDLSEAPARTDGRAPRSTS
jgi:uncharacterized protein (DUF1800 family)